LWRHFAAGAGFGGSRAISTGTRAGQATGAGYGQINQIQIAAQWHQQPATIGLPAVVQNAVDHSSALAFARRFFLVAQALFGDQALGVDQPLRRGGCGARE
jgi:hypothetical protein